VLADEGSSRNGGRTVNGGEARAAEHRGVVALKCARQRGDDPFIGDARAC
jgi:hypothetical protein